MKILLFTCLSGLLVSADAFGQSVKCDSVYTTVDEMPLFKGGFDQLPIYLSENVDFESCGPNAIKVITWTINWAGEVIDIDVPGADADCKARIVGQLSKFPRWTPGKIMGMPVCVRFAVRKPKAG